MDTQTRTPAPPGYPVPEPRRVQARVALVVLETLRAQDLPPEVLDDEDLTLTLPRRLGLSDVIEAQIRRYRQDARRSRRIPEAEAIDLMRLVVRRPDSDEVFKLVGERFTVASEAARWRKVYPRRFAMRLARKRVERRLRALFGGPVVVSAGAPFSLTAVGDLLLNADPGGDACAMVTGLGQAILRAYGCAAVEVTHPECRGRGGDRCFWTLAPEP